MGFHGFSKIVFLVCDHFPPPLLIALSVVYGAVVTSQNGRDIVTRSAGTENAMEGNIE